MSGFGRGLICLPARPAPLTMRTSLPNAPQSRFWPHMAEVVCAILALQTGRKPAMDAAELHQCSLFAGAGHNVTHTAFLRGLWRI